MSLFMNEIEVDNLINITQNDTSNSIVWLFIKNVNMESKSIAFHLSII